MLPPEDTFILSVLRAQLTPATARPVLPAALNGARLLQRLRLHRLSAYFHALVREQGLEWPAELLEPLQHDRISLTFYGQGCLPKVRQVLHAFNEAGIPVIVLKGWAHIQTVYGGDPGQRTCEDIDLLVHPRHASAAEAALRGLHCRLDPESWPGYNRRYQNGCRYYFENHPDDPARTFSVGLHWGLLHIPAYDPRLVDVDELFARAHPLTVAGVPVLELAAEDFIVYTCAHLGLHHRFDPSFFRYYELAAAIRQAGAALDWARVASQAARWHYLLPLRFGLERTEALFPGQIPAAAFHSLAGHRSRLGEHLLKAWIHLTRSRPAFDHALTWLAFPDWKQRPLIFLQDVFPSRAYMQWRYGRGPLAWLYLKRMFSGLAFLFGGR